MSHSAHPDYSSERFVAAGRDDEPPLLPRLRSTAQSRVVSVGDHRSELTRSRSVAASGSQARARRKHSGLAEQTSHALARTHDRAATLAQYRSCERAHKRVRGFRPCACQWRTALQHA